ncbi:2,3-bisphosphoglycerate-independent phosphoglycerate mutase [Streptomyces longispororuber]|uniref:2,3-bisphosphoglycerate-independent phosphoglycerate mutase n=1 Tax=Streptomyces longispororuber TaxID=68230 RepID=UPI00167C79ED|nr:2,3-bisphosphoglycerate-independent phosphoglycerate mutase [Streptomyces longispororuber]
MGPRLVLLVLDGFGWAPDGAHNPLREADTPFLAELAARTPPTLLDASGAVVGLPAGQVGNSEVGHLTMGTGRTVPQAAVVIDRAIADGTLRERLALGGVFTRARAAGSTVHVVGIASTGGAHGHLDHIAAVLDLAEAHGWAERTVLHAVGDGRDVPARSLLDDLGRLERRGARIATVVGRRYAMDRSGRLERTALVVDALTGAGPGPVDDWRAAVAAQYGSGATDEQLRPIVLDAPRVAPGDEVVMTNFRPDGLRQLATALAASGRRLTTMTRYGDDVPAAVVVDRAPVDGTLAQAVAGAGLAQLHVAEREKYGHVTYLFNGYTQRLQPGERHLLIDSRTDVPGFDRAPEMSAREVTAAVVRELESGGAHFVVANLANVDTVGHTGAYAAVREAAEVVDGCLRAVARAADRHGARVLITADHGNGERMREADGTTPHTRHTANPVPLWAPGTDRVFARTGDLRDIAPTCLDLLGVAPPPGMTGRVL